MDDSQRRVSDLLFFIERLQVKIRELMAENTKLKHRIRGLEGPKNLSVSKKKTKKKALVKSV